jgi:hypothetical protein
LLVELLGAKLPQHFWDHLARYHNKQEENIPVEYLWLSASKHQLLKSLLDCKSGEMDDQQKDLYPIEDIRLLACA